MRLANTPTDDQASARFFGNKHNPMGYSSNSYNIIQLLANADSSPVRKYTREGTDIDSVFDVYAVFQQQDLSIEDMPDFLWPAKEKYGL